MMPVDPVTAMVFLGLAPIVVFSLLYAIDGLIGWIRGEND